ncbi:MAG: TerD family protein [Actinomycetes bacterium]
MGVSLSKSDTAPTAAQSPGLSSVVVGLGWDARTSAGRDFDLDASALLLGADGRVLSDAHFVFFNNPSSPHGAVVHAGDNVSGAGEGDDEQITLDLAALPVEVARVALVVSIYDAESRAQTFGLVPNAIVRVVDATDGTEIARYDLSADVPRETVLVLGELYRRGPAWRFHALGHVHPGGLHGLAADLGVTLL